MRRTPRTLIANEGYEIGWTQFDGLFFNQPLPLTIVNGVAVPTPSPANQQDPSLNFDWGTQLYTIPLNSGSQGQILQVDNFRNLLVIQNNSVASGTDIAPTLFVAVDGPVQTLVVSNPTPNTFAYNALVALSPGEGVILDVRVPRNALYSVWGSYVNTGNSVFINGTLSYGRTTNAPPEPVVPPAYGSNVLARQGYAGSWALGPQRHPGF
jgi:hypothetical protein